MHLLRVQIPEFRALRNVSIIFEKELSPSVFPVGSLNGGGKSTLLQLIFALLHCSANKERNTYLINLLKTTRFENIDGIKTLATMEIEDKGRIICLEFLLVRYIYSEIPSEQLKELMLNAEKKQNVLQICAISVADEEQEYLFCRITGMTSAKITLFLTEVSYKVFLAAPPTQLFLFLSQEEKTAIFQGQDRPNSFRYDDAVLFLKSKLPGFFTYDFVNIDLIVEAFQRSINADVREFTETGNYGKSASRLQNELSALLFQKKVVLIPDVSGKLTEIAFVLDSGNDETIILSPEDLSYGELKRLSIYVWIKYRNIREAIVLMDEIEIGLHPDWQHEIVRDLAEWSPSNQYILATRSWELCQALTPAHVKEIEPKLLK